MKKITLPPFYGFCLLTFAVLISAGASGQNKRAASGYYRLEDFQKVRKYDTHIHIRKDDASLIEQAKADNFHLLDINVNSPYAPPVEQQQVLALKQVKAFPQQMHYASTISVDKWASADWQAETLEYLKKSLDRGAVGVKVWKNIGMQLKDADGKFVMIDDARFDPLFDYLAARKITLISHQGEPRNCWLPVDQMTVEGDKHYYTEHPQFHMYLHPEYPTYEDQIRARDHMVEKHPDLKIVSVHLASLEWSVDEIAKRLDKYPNLAVDMAARVPHLQLQASKDWKKVYDFFIKYQDRLLYGTDIVIAPGDQRTEAAIRASAHAAWLNDWRFFTGDEQLSNGSKTTYRGLKLPKEVVDKIYYQNAERWFPLLAKR